MATKKEQKSWEEKQKNEIIKIFEKLGFRPDLQMLKAKVMGVPYASLLNLTGEKLEEYIKKWHMEKYEDDQLLSHIDQLEENEKGVVMAKYGIGKDGVYISSKETAEITGVSSRKVPHLHKKALSKLKDLYLDCVNTETKSIGL